MAVPVSDPAPCQLLPSLAPHGKRHWEVKGPILTWTLPRPLERSPRGRIRLRTSVCLPVYTGLCSAAPVVSGRAERNPRFSQSELPEG